MYPENLPAGSMLKKGCTWQRNDEGTDISKYSSLGAPDWTSLDIHHDFLAAFNTVDYDILLDFQRYHIGVEGSVLYLLRSCLGFCADVLSELSELYNVLCPQASIAFKVRKT